MTDGSMLLKLAHTSFCTAEIHGQTIQRCREREPNLHFSVPVVPAICSSPRPPHPERTGERQVIVGLSPFCPINAVESVVPEGLRERTG